MARAPRIWGIHAEPPRWLKWQLAILPFAILIVTYMFGSHARHQANPKDRIMPSMSKMASTVHALAFTEDEITGKFIMLDDTLTSLKRMGIGLAMAAFLGLILGMNMGMFPGMDATIEPFVIFISIVPPLAILPILFIVFGADELGKVMLIFLGTFFFVAREVRAATEAIPKEETTKALTLGASQIQLTYRIVLPQILPRLIDIVRACIAPAWLFLIAAEAIASDSGLGYRIFLSRRNTSMDIIIPYDIWITFLGFAIDHALNAFSRWKYPWYAAAR
jgi:NitT/TauT family transport system permease protein